MSGCRSLLLLWRFLLELIAIVCPLPPVQSRRVFIFCLSVLGHPTSRRYARNFAAVLWRVAGSIRVHWATDRLIKASADAAFTPPSGSLE